MAHCAKCGAAVGENAGFCGACGAPVSTGGAPATSTSSPGDTQSIMDENIAGLLCYLIGWVTGVIFLVTDKRSFVRFHATQSIVVFAGLSILWWIVGIFFGMALFTAGFAGFSLALLMYRLLELVGIVLWIVLMIKAYQGQRFRVPIAADLAEKIFGKS
jgi:uncharacterized membrane protein